MSNKLDPVQTRHFVRPDLDKKCILRLSADDNRSKKENFEKCQTVSDIQVSHLLELLMLVRY